MNIILFGAPGSGKGTQAVEMCKKMSLRKISLGDILRDEVKKQSTLGKEVESYMKQGLLVPDEVVGKVIKETITGNDFILDGYPRNDKQAQVL
ncbi:MAG: nucleoside monophosphate kinase, partial [Candidatus Omnitrophica bacterium]|nr:nucleoside monophosphate kinase [Candidatus Omnitrophota bacterium]